MPDFDASLARAVRTLSRRDPVIRDLKKRHGVPTFGPRDDHFESLVRSIVSQQISGAAAKSILTRLELALGDLRDHAHFLRHPDEVYRSSGVSPQKLSYLRSLAEHVDKGELDVFRLGEEEDEEVIRRLVQVKGVGVWTAKMFLMFSLGRLDVLPFEDLGVRNGIRLLFDFEDLPGRAEIEAIAEERGWAPYRSVASWYMWRALED